jgi:hypothetical protein
VQPGKSTLIYGIVQSVFFKGKIPGLEVFK